MRLRRQTAVEEVDYRPPVREIARTSYTARFRGCSLTNRK
jgi:hypothetical protein